jgi:hypothetical protein
LHLHMYWGTSSKPRQLQDNCGAAQRSQASWCSAASAHLLYSSRASSTATRSRCEVHILNTPISDTTSLSLGAAAAHIILLTVIGSRWWAGQRHRRASFRQYCAAPPLTSTPHLCTKDASEQVPTQTGACWTAADIPALRCGAAASCFTPPAAVPHRRWHISCTRDVRS